MPETSPIYEVSWTTAAGVRPRYFRRRFASRQAALERYRELHEHGFQLWPLAALDLWQVLITPVEVEQ
jgi:hypothetical protein